MQRLGQRAVRTTAILKHIGFVGGANGDAVSLKYKLGTPAP